MTPEDLNQFDRLFLDHLELLDDCDCGLRLRVRPALGSGYREELEVAGRLFEDVERVVPDPGVCIEIEFPHFATYAVRSESYWSAEKSKLPKAVYHVLADSHFLDYCSRVSFAADDLPNPGKLRHYMIACLNHLVDVIAWSPPTVARVEEGGRRPC
ncbi:hypothetical protein ABI59_04455 [Acidobacteria bacterium Mor1]|nr:hypothetical protein ABI59_04455 [Acidobacteria bacterium Mor1]